MKTHANSTVSPWREPSETITTPELSESVTCDVCLVGAGIAGLSVAYHLAQAGKKVVVLDDGPIGGGETGRTTAHLSNAIDKRYYELEKFHGLSGAKLAADSHTAAVDRIDSIISKEDIACDFTRLDGYLYQPDSTKLQLLDDELKAAHRAGLTEVSRLDRVPLESFQTGPCLRFPRQGQFHVLKYLHGLAKAIVRAGGAIYHGAHVVSVEGGKVAVIKTDKDRIITAGAVVVATNTPINDRYAMHTKQSAYRTYAIGMAMPLEAESFTGLLWDGFWNNDDSYHYVRRQPGPIDGLLADQDLLIVGGEDHKTGQADDAEERYSRLGAWARERFPTVQKVLFKWSGQVMEPVDGLAYIGRNPADEPNVYIATGDSGLGMTHGTIAGMLISDLILGHPNPWAELYDPSRKTLKSGVEFVKGNVNVLTQYKDWITPGSVESVDQIPPGCGAVIRRGVSKVAIYRDPEGNLHERSAVCPHLGCVVRWNSIEKTWDCPCHGSRFDVEGCVLNAPAVSPLAEL